MIKDERIVVKTYDYPIPIDKDTKSKLIWLAGEICRNTRDHVKSAIEMGESISTAHDLLAGIGCEGQFKPWLEKECNLSRASAYQYMNAYRRLGKCPALDTYAAEAMYALAAPTTPDEALKEAEKEAKKGKRITIDVAKSIINKWRERLKPADHNALPTNGEAAKPAIETPESHPESFDPEEIEASTTGLDIKQLAEPYKEALRMLSDIDGTFKDLAADEKLGAHLVDCVTRIHADIRTLKTTISQSQPVKVCESCEGEGCRSCQNTGFWTRQLAASRKAG